MSIRVGVVGTGFIGRGAVDLIGKTPGMCVSRVLTRREFDGVRGIGAGMLTHSPEQLADESDIIVECSGDAVHATKVLDEIARAGLPIITMDAELQVTTGSYFASRTYFTEADGDQPGCLARLKAEAESMGFVPWVYGNIKGYLNRNPSREDMVYWSARQDLTLDQCTAFTDGSKLEIEQVLVANGLNADILEGGMDGGKVDDLKDIDYLATLARSRSRPLSDYALCAKAPPGVFLLADHELAHRIAGYGPFEKLMTRQGYCLLVRTYHLTFMEIPRTIDHVIRDRPPLLNNSTEPRYGAAAIAKVPLKPGRTIQRALGSFEVRGAAASIRANPNHVPICLMNDAVIRREVGPDQPIRFDDVELPESRALEIYLEIRRAACAAPVGTTVDISSAMPIQHQSI